MKGISFSIISKPGAVQWEYLNYHGIISPAYVVLKLTPALDPRFADYLFKSRVMIDQFVTSSKGVGDIQRDIYWPWLKKTKVPVPPLPEQKEIAAYLDQELHHVDRQLLLVEREVTLVNEFFERLLTSIVLGEVDVRSFAASLSRADNGAVLLTTTPIAGIEDSSTGQEESAI